MGYNQTWWYPKVSGFIGVEGHFLQYPVFFSHRHSYGIEHLQLRTEYVYIIVYIYYYICEYMWLRWFTYSKNGGVFSMIMLVYRNVDALFEKRCHGFSNNWGTPPKKTQQSDNPGWNMLKKTEDVPKQKSIWVLSRKTPGLRRPHRLPVLFYLCPKVPCPRDIAAGRFRRETWPNRCYAPARVALNVRHPTSQNFSNIAGESKKKLCIKEWKNISNSMGSSKPCLSTWNMIKIFQSSGWRDQSSKGNLKDGEKELIHWLVVGPPLWKIWVRQLGWWQQPNINGKIKLMFQTTNQFIVSFPPLKWS